MGSDHPPPTPVPQRDAADQRPEPGFSHGTGINNKTKLLKRQAYGRAGFALLRQRILLN
jgi:hypothetical protein